MEDKVTVIVPVYKIRENDLRQCISSLLNQSRSDYKIVLVDDGSPDNCGKICDEFAQKSEKITVVHQENQGVSVARNNGIIITTTEWLTFVDADDWVEESYISTIYNTIECVDKETEMFMFNYVREYKNSRSIEKLGVNEGYLDFEVVEQVKKAAYYKLFQNGVFNPYSVISLMAKAYKTSFIKGNNLWFVPEAKKGQDRIFNADALCKVKKIYYIDKLLYHYRCWEESRVNRYDPQMPKLTILEIDNLKTLAIKNNMEEELGEYITCRTCTRLYACLRLYYFNKENPASFKNKIKGCRALVQSSPFKEAFENVNMNFLNQWERIFVVCVKCRLYCILYILVRIKSGLFKRKLN